MVGWLAKSQEQLSMEVQLLRATHHRVFSTMRAYMHKECRVAVALRIRLEFGGDPAGRGPREGGAGAGRPASSAGIRRQTAGPSRGIDVTAKSEDEHHGAAARQLRSDRGSHASRDQQGARTVDGRDFARFKRRQRDLVSPGQWRLRWQRPDKSHRQAACMNAEPSTRTCHRTWKQTCDESNIEWRFAALHLYPQMRDFSRVEHYGFHVIVAHPTTPTPRACSHLAHVASAPHDTMVLAKQCVCSPWCCYLSPLSLSSSALLWRSLCSRLAVGRWRRWVEDGRVDDAGHLPKGMRIMSV
jgi:hypothetical protein